MSRHLLRQLAERKATLILAAFSLDECEATRERLMRSVPGTEEVGVDCRRLDLNSTRSIRRFAGALRQDYPAGIDRIILQPPSVLSGVIAGEWRPTADGFEHQLGNNFFSFYLLTRLLTAIGATPGRADRRVILAVDMHAAMIAEKVAERGESGGEAGVVVKLPVDDWNWSETSKEAYNPSGGYQRAQWALRLFADELAARSRGTGLSVMISDPEVNRTSLVPTPMAGSTFAPLRWVRGVGRGLLSLGNLLTRVSASKVGATTLMCTVAEKGALGLDTSAAPSDAPVFRGLQRVSPAGEQDEEKIDRRQAREVLWTLGEKWTRLDTHSEAVPLPPRV